MARILDKLDEALQKDANFKGLASPDQKAEYAYRIAKKMFGSHTWSLIKSPKYNGKAFMDETSGIVYAIVFNSFPKQFTRTEWEYQYGAIKKQ